MTNIDLLPALRDLADGHRTAYATVSYASGAAEILHIGATKQPNEPLSDRLDGDVLKALIEVGFVALPEQGSSTDRPTNGRCTVTEAGLRTLAEHR